MANQITETGITIQSLPEILDEILNGSAGYSGLKAIYGVDINLDPNSPDGQLVNIIAQAKSDILEFINQVFSSFDPDQAVGVNLDRRCAINGIARAGGTRTQQPVTITVDRARTLTGLNDDPNNTFTVQDGQGNKYQLITSYAFSAAGSASLNFQAVEVGAVSSALNSITVATTVLLGVTGVNNPTDATSIGVAQESDAALRVRRSRSVAIPSQGYLDGLLGSLLDLGEVTQVEVFENVTDTTDIRGIPAHSIWAIVAGGNSAEIAEVIYRKKSLGCGMRGSVTEDITQDDGLITTIQFDRPIAQPIYIRFNVEAMTGIVDLDYLREQILARLSYSIYQQADASSVVAVVKTVYPNASVSEEGVSTDDVLYYSLVQPDTVQHQFTIAKVEINGTIS